MATDPQPESLRGPIAWMAGNSVASNLLMVVFLVGGFLFGLRIKQEVFPETAIDIVTVSVPYPGASPEEVEQSIILAIEEAIRGLDGVKKVSSLAAEGSATVAAELLLGADLQTVAQDIQSAVDRITSFPTEAEEPRVSTPTLKRTVISLVLHGAVEETVLRAATERVRDQLLADPGITQVELEGIRPYEISIEIPQAKLREHGLTLDQVAARLRGASIELPGGGIKTGGGEILLRMKERRDLGREFERIPIVSTEDGTQLYLEDIATIRDGFEDLDESMTYNGEPATMITVYRVGKETPTEVAATVRRHVEDLSQSLPPGLSVAVWEDMSKIFQQRMDLLLRNAAVGLVLVLILLSLFLESRLAFWVTMGIPISFLGTFLFLPMFDVSINMVSLFAFIISLGIVVDDAIVVGENVYENHQRGMGFMEAAKLGAREVALPVTFSILTNIAAFMPMFFVPGVMGKIFRVIPAVVVTVFMLSLVESLFILPAHLAHAREAPTTGFRGRLHRRQQRFSYWFSRMIQTRYGPLIERVVARRYLVFAAGLGILIVTVGFVRSGRMGMSMFPRIDADYAFATATLPYGSSVERTKAVRDRLIEAARQVASAHGEDELMRGILARIGSSGTDGPFAGNVATGGSRGHLTEVGIHLADPEQRPLTTAEVTRAWRERVGPIPGIKSLVFESNRGGPGAGAALTVQLSHTDLHVLDRAATELADTLAGFPIVKDIDSGFSPGKQQIDFKILPEGQSLGLTAAEVARQVRNAYYGAEVVRQQRGRNEIKVMVRLPEAERVSEFNLEQFMVRTPAGTDVPLREVVDLQRGRAFTSINRSEGRRVITVTADVDPPDQAPWVQKSINEDILPELVERYPGLKLIYEGQQADMAESMMGLAVGFALAMLVLYALLAVPFKSYVQPVIVMVSIPFGLVGAVLGHLLMGYSLSVMSMFGVVALSGVVINDSLILIDFANRERRKGASAHDAILAAGVRRFRPIMLTTMTTFGGLAPMIFETSMQARFLIPMAISLGYGIVFATVITLGLVPSLYLIVDDVQRGAVKLWGMVARGDGA